MAWIWLPFSSRYFIWWIYLRNSESGMGALLILSRSVWMVVGNFWAVGEYVLYYVGVGYI